MSKLKVILVSLFVANILALFVGVFYFNLGQHKIFSLLSSSSLSSTTSLHKKSSSTTNVNQEEMSQVLCFSTHTNKHLDRFSVDELDLITPSSPLVSDRYKICIVSNMCIDDSGKVLLFHPSNTSDVSKTLPAILPFPQASQQLFTHDRDFIKKLLIDNPIEGNPAQGPVHRVEIIDSTYQQFEKLKGSSIRNSSKWLLHSIPTFWMNYYHIIIDAYYQTYVTLSQVSYLVSEVLSKGLSATHISPTASLDTVAEIIEKRDYEIFIVTKYDTWNNRVINTLEKAFPQPIVADSGSGNSYTCSSRGVIGLSYAFGRDNFASFVNHLVKRPSKLELQMLNQYLSFIMRAYEHLNTAKSEPQPTLNVLLVRRTKNRVVTNLDAVSQYIKEKYGNYTVVDIIDNSQHSFEQQLLYHQWADVIVSSHGADETNMFFARKGSILIEIESTAHYEPFFQVYSQRLGYRHYLFRGTGDNKNSPRVIDMNLFVPFFEVALCYGDSYVGNKLIYQTSTKSKFCDWIRSENRYKTEDFDKHLKERVNAFENFDKDEKLDEIGGKYLEGCCI